MGSIDPKIHQSANQAFYCLLDFLLFIRINTWTRIFSFQISTSFTSLS